VELLTIGAFARAARLTPKALRLYDEVGLLPPAAVDPESGYRFYDPEQLAHARLIARLRRIGMPLADIRTVCGLEPDAAAKAVTAYWQQVTGATASTAAVNALEALEQADKPAVDLLAMLAATVNDVDRAVRATSTDDNQPATTLTAVLRRGSQLALVHIGDTRVYLLRGGELSRLTQDHRVAAPSPRQDVAARPATPSNAGRGLANGRRAGPMTSAVALVADRGSGLQRGKKAVDEVGGG
jgi:DNA-binding transcriptional MerR regulator